MYLKRFSDRTNKENKKNDIIFKNQKKIKEINSSVKLGTWICVEVLSSEKQNFSFLNY